MAERARPLRLLRIDDDLDAGGSADLPQFAAQRAPRHLESVELHSGNRSVPGIRSWEDAIAFWSGYDPRSPIDLVIADVRFDDKTSPLAALAADADRLPLPTGISHFKAFAALARGRGHPVGVGLHTKEANVWRAFTRHHNRDRRIMAFLAAHEIGELAAILGEAADLDRLDAASCFEWLERRRAQDFRAAIPAALTQYRKALGGFRLMPEDFEDLVSWCGRMEASAGADGVTALRLTDEQDLGFPIPSAVGTRDVVSIRSLFADVLIERVRFSFEHEGLPKTCFEVKEDDDYFRLDNGNPRIGALVYRCGELGRAYRRAVELVQLMKVPGEGAERLNLAEAKPRAGAGYLDAGIAIMLMDVEREFAIHSAWRALYSNYVWNPVRDSFCGEKALDRSVTLQSWLSRISKAAVGWGSIGHQAIADMFAEAGDSVIDAGAVPEESDDDAGIDPGEADVGTRLGWPGTRRCIDLLRQMEVLDADGGRYVPGPTPFSWAVTPQCPRRPPAGFTGISGLSADFGQLDHLHRPHAALRRLLGYGTANDGNILQRNVAKGFGLKLEDSLKFIEDFRRGRPSVLWIKSVARGYARDIGWTDEASWPASLSEERPVVVSSNHRLDPRR